MAKFYGRTGCLTTLLHELHRNGIDGCETMDDIRAFHDGCNHSLHHIREEQRTILRQSIARLELYDKNLSTELAALKTQGNFLKQIRGFFKKRRVARIKRAVKIAIENRKNNAEQWIASQSASALRRQEKILAVLHANKNLFYGAEGEEKVVGELAKLPDAYAVINDYRVKFSTPIHDKRNNDRIYSVQVDHIIIGPTGIYLVETKNWSRDSVENIDLFSPVKQLRRHNFAMFVLLNRSIEKGCLKGFSDHWGDRKISPRNIILLTHHKPHKEFQYVKVLLVKEIIRHIAREKVTFTPREVASLTEYLL